MGLRQLKGFTAMVPEGWTCARAPMTYSEETLHAPTRIVPAHRRGELLVTWPALDFDELPGLQLDALSEMLQAWGLRRGMATPLASTAELGRGVARATASYRLGGHFTQVWLVSTPSALLQATWVSLWDRRDEERETRDALASSLLPT